ncbi:hypothetical protein [Bacillus cereus]|uniref:hypothetical protein n=1 Tax=Bacillus cereus TaxID=1396 RepID=UPI0018F76DB6|nr:hypothetical protein [Bacillus cereus]
MNFLAYNFLEMIWNVVSVKVDIDKKEANENIKELTTAANECVDALERLEKELGRFFVSPILFSAVTSVMAFYSFE